MAIGCRKLKDAVIVQTAESDGFFKQMRSNSASPVQLVSRESLQPSPANIKGHWLKQHKFKPTAKKITGKNSLQVLELQLYIYLPYAVSSLQDTD